MTDLLQQQTERLGEHLLASGLISHTMFEVARAEQSVTSERIGSILVKNGFVSQSELIAAIHAVDLNQISSEQALITKCPAELLLETRTMVLAETDDVVYLASTTDEDTIEQLFRPHYHTETFSFIPVSFDILDEYLDKIERIARNEGALVDRLLRRALRDSISDVHIAPRSKSYSVFFRFNGVLQHAHEGTLEEYQALVAQIKDRSKLDLAERRIPQDGAFQVEHNGRMIDMRVATIPTVEGEKVVIRLLDPNRVQPSLDLLGVTHIKKWRDGFSNADGICLICGPTGSGKTTTLNATVREMDRFGKSINSLEDPVEYRIPYVSQVNINHAVGLNFAQGVRAFMRGDPEIIICGEIRDIETAENAIKASETGHLVLGTLHTGSIRGTIDRLRDIGVPVHDLRYLLRSVMVQRLIRTVCRHCGASGCPSCYGSGYGGRCVISEIEYFRSPEDVDRMAEGIISWPTMIEDAISKVKEGITTAEEVVRLFGEQGRAMLAVHGLNYMEPEAYA